MRSIAAWLIIWLLTFCRFACAQTQEDIQDAINIAGDAGGGVVVLPPGVTDVFSNINLRPNVTIEGHPDGSTLRIVDEAGNWLRALLVENDDNVILRNFEIDGNKHSRKRQGEHSNGVFIYRSDNVVVENVDCFDHYGDGIQLYVDTDNITIRDCRLFGNERSGIGLTGHGTGINLINLDIGDMTRGQGIDFEVSNAGSIYRDVTITGCAVEMPENYTSYAIALSSIHGGLVENNSFGGAVNIIRCNDVRFVRNDVDADGRAVVLNYSSNNTLIAENLLFARGGDPANQYVVTEAIYCRATGEEWQTDLTIANNVISTDCRHVATLWGGVRTKVIANTITHNGDSYVFNCRSTRDMRDMIVSSNNVESTSGSGFLRFGGYQDYKHYRPSVFANVAGGGISFSSDAKLINPYLDE